MPRASHSFSSGSESRSSRLKRFWTEAMSVNSIASSSCSAVTESSPMCRILPSARNSSSAPSWSAIGTAGSSRCNW